MHDFFVASFEDYCLVLRGFIEKTFSAFLVVNIQFIRWRVAYWFDFSIF